MDDLRDKLFHEANRSTALIIHGLFEPTGGAPLLVVDEQTKAAVRKLVGDVLHSSRRYLISGKRMENNGGTDGRATVES